MNKIILLISLLVFLTTASAFQYQLLPNGTLQEINYTINGTPVDFVIFNDSIYVIPKNYTTNATINTTIINVTNVTHNNITNINMTCFNCTNHYNLTTNGTYWYNKSDVDSRFVLIADFNSYKSNAPSNPDLSSYATDSELSTAITDLNSTINGFNFNSSGWMWASIIILFLIEIGIVVIILRS